MGLPVLGIRAGSVVRALPDAVGGEEEEEDPAADADGALRDPAARENRMRENRRKKERGR